MTKWHLQTEHIYCQVGNWVNGQKCQEDGFSLFFIKLCQASVAFFSPVKTALVSYLAIIRVEMLSHKGTKSKGVQKCQLRDQAGAHLFDSTLQPFETIWSSNTMVKISAAVGQGLPKKSRANWARHYGKLHKMSKTKQTFTVVLVI